MRKTLLRLGIACLLLGMAGMTNAQEKAAKLHTYVMEKPYDVQKIFPPKGKKVKNVILMIGDGMSLMHVYSAWTANRGKLYLDNCQYVGLSKTYCADKLITDSGAGGTAIAIGQKTNYHYVGVDVNGNPQPSLITLAKQNGLSAGVAVTCRLWDATPADFCCHNVDRDNEYAIIADYVNCGADYVVGGGAEKFVNRPDGRDIFKELEAKGYQIARSWEECQALKDGKIFAVTEPKDTPLPAERGSRLADSALKGMNLMDKNEKGFFMMIEGSQLDDYGHFSDLDLLMQETHDFDRTVGKVFEWAAKDGETLVIVTADHETGGLTLVDGNLQKGEIQCRFSTTSHSGVMVPVYAFGPGSENFSGMYENTDIFHKIVKLLNLNK